jgi:Na+/proline symporter
MSWEILLSPYSIVIVLYIVIIIGISIWRSRGVKDQDDFMVAGRSVSALLLVGTLVCTWIGAGSLLGGGGKAFRGGISQLWMSAGAWLAIVIVFFLADRVRRISKYTVQDLLEQRYHPAARVLGAIVVVLGSTTIFSYQLRGGAFVLEYLMQLPQVWGIIATATVIIVFTMLAGLRSIVSVDIFNGILIILAIFIGLPLMLGILGGLDLQAEKPEPAAAQESRVEANWFEQVQTGVDHVFETLPEKHFTLFGIHENVSETSGDEFGYQPQSKADVEAMEKDNPPVGNPFLGLVWALGVFFPTFFLLLGESSIYQKFYSARSEKTARQAVIGFLIGVIVLETGLTLFSITSSSHPKADLWRRSYDRFAQAEIGLIKQELQLEKARTQLGTEATGAQEAESEAKFEAIMKQRTVNWNRLVEEIEPRTLAVTKLPAFDPKNPKQYLEAATALYGTRTDSINLFSAFELLPVWAGLLLLGGAMAIILSTGNSFLMAASTALVRDIWQRFLRPNAGQKEIVWVQRLIMVVLAVFAVLQLTLLKETVWQMALAAYTLIGAGLTPVILAAFLWKRVTAAGGVASVAAGLGTWTLFVSLKIAKVIDLDYDFIIYPAAAASILALIIVSLLTKPSAPEVYRPFMTKPAKSE